MDAQEIGRRIRLARESYRGVGMKQTELARRIGVGQPRLSNWESGKHEPNPISIVDRIAEALEVTAEHLMTGVVPPRTPGPRAVSGRKVKFYGVVSAGQGNAAGATGGEIEVPVELCREDYGALVIDGDSTMPFLRPGDVAVFCDCPDVKLGLVVAANVNNEWVVKLVVYEDGKFLLRSLNPKYPDVEGPYRIAGFLVGLVRDDGPERTIRTNPYGLKP